MYVPMAFPAQRYMYQDTRTLLVMRRLTGWFANGLTELKIVGTFDVKPFTIKSTLKHEVARVHEAEWRNLHSCRQAKFVLKKPGTSRSVFQ